MTNPVLDLNAMRQRILSGDPTVTEEELFSHIQALRAQREEKAESKEKKRTASAKLSPKEFEASLDVFDALPKSGD